jgi:predicted transposase YdaD
MYRYHYRLQDRHPNRRIASFAILTDRNPARQLGHYRQTLWRTEIDFKFPVIRLQDWHDRRADLENSPNPFALVVLAQLDAHRTRQDDTARKVSKFGLIRLLLSRDYARQDIMELLRVIDWLMQLPDELERQLTHEIKQLEAEAMTYVMSIERLALEQGKLEGRVEGRVEGKIEGEADLLRRQLVKRFGPLPDAIQQRLDRATSEQLEIWAERILDASTLSAVFDDY